MARLRQAQGGLGDGGVFVGNPPEGKVINRADYALYMFFKLRVERQQEWDEQAYLARHPKVAQMINNGTVVDGLQHFMNTGFAAGVASCWRNKHSIKPMCI